MEIRSMCNEIVLLLIDSDSEHSNKSRVFVVTARGPLILEGTLKFVLGGQTENSDGGVNCMRISLYA
jgi:hypothetical protein